jgi:hypothetical protein
MYENDRMVSCNTCATRAQTKEIVIVVLVVDEIGRNNALLSAVEDIEVLFPNMQFLTKFPS